MRKGMMVGRGSGYKNVVARDPAVHSQSAQGIKQPQHINIISPNALPIYKIGGMFYFRDVRLGEYRNVSNPSDRKRIDDVNNSELQKWTKKDSEFIFGKEKEMKEHNVVVDYDNEKSMEKAETLATILIRDGFNLKNTKQIGFNKFEITYEKDKEQLKGGLGDNKPDSAFDKKELAKGIKVEMEHTNNPEIAKEVTKDHLSEFGGKGKKGYYSNLAKMENKLKKEEPKVLNLTRVSYGKSSTPAKDREYQIDGKGAVGTIEEYKKQFPNSKFNINNPREDSLTFKTKEDAEKYFNQLQGTQDKYSRSSYYIKGKTVYRY